MSPTPVKPAIVSPAYRVEDVLPLNDQDIVWFEFFASEILFCQVQPYHWEKQLLIKVDESRPPFWSVNGTGDCTVSGYGVSDDGSGVFNPPQSTFVDESLNPHLPAGSLCGSFWSLDDLPIDKNNSELTLRLWKHLFAGSHFLGGEASVAIPRGSKYLALSINCSFEHYSSNAGSAYITSRLK